MIGTDTTNTVWQKLLTTPTNDGAHPSTLNTPTNYQWAYVMHHFISKNNITACLCLLFSQANLQLAYK